MEHDVATKHGPYLASSPGSLVPRRQELVPDLEPIDGEREAETNQVQHALLVLGSQRPGTILNFVRLQRPRM